MLSKEDNERLTRVGPGTPGGELLRRYWQPVCIAAELTAEQPKKRVRVLGEDLIVYRTGGGDYGLVEEHCAHRGASLYYGLVEGEGIRCVYHGWMYDVRGNCRDQPFEPKGATFCQRIKLRSYPVQKLAGLLFAYLGPQPAPLLPRWDVLVWENGRRKLARGAPLNCNWLQAQENAVDPTHGYFLHGHVLHSKGLPDPPGHLRPLVEYGFQTFEWGVITSWHWAAGGGALGEEQAGGNPIIFPNALAHAAGASQWMIWRVPIDDTHTQIFSLEFKRSPDGSPPAPAEEPSVSYLPSWVGEDGEYLMDTIISQDTMAWETQGPVADRTREHLGAADRGIVLFRQMLREQIEAVERGGDPLGVIRDPARNVIIELPGLVVSGDPRAVTVYGMPALMAKPAEQVFDRRHEVYEVPFGSARPAKVPRRHGAE